MNSLVSMDTVIAPMLILLAACGGGNSAADTPFNSGTGSGLYLGGPFITYQTAAARRIVRIDTTGKPN